MSIPIARYRETCRVSGGPLRDVLDLGPMHLSGFIRPGDPVPPTVPLTLAVNDESGLVQLRHSVDPDLMFRDYWYRSGINEKMRAHLAGVVEDVMGRVRLKRGDHVLDIGCNDGTMLRCYPNEVDRVGIDPSNSEPTGINTFINDYFDAIYFTPRSFKVVTSIACLYDVEDPVRFAGDIATVLRPDGIWITEQHYLPAMLATNDYSAVCHEHREYYDLRSLEYIVNQAGLEVFDVALNDSNGGSFRAYIGRAGQHKVTDAVWQMREEEYQRLDIHSFRARVRCNRNATLELLTSLKESGKRLAALGASTKFNTVLQYCSIGPDLIEFASERTPEKVGLYTVGSNIPIVSEEDARRANPDYFVVGPWHFLDAIARRERDYIANGGQFIVLFPYPRVVSCD